MLYCASDMLWNLLQSYPVGTENTLPGLRLRLRKWTALTASLHGAVHKPWMPNCTGNQFCKVMPNIFRLIGIVFSLYKTLYQFTCTEQKAPDNTEVERSIQNCGSSAWNVLHVTLPAPRISRWLLDFWKICSPLYSLPPVLAQKQLPFTVKLFLMWISQWQSICAPVTAQAYISSAYWAAVLLQHCN